MAQVHEFISFDLDPNDVLSEEEERELLEEERLKAQKMFAKETDSNVIIRNLSVISTETLVCVLSLFYFNNYKYLSVRL